MQLSPLVDKLKILFSIQNDLVNVIIIYVERAYPEILKNLENEQIQEDDDLEDLEILLLN